MIESKEMRAVCCETLMELAEHDPRIVVLDSDLSSACGTKPFAARFPSRHVNVGIAEANMIGVAAGMASCGKIPFAYSFATFASRRCFDQITVSVGYAKLNVRIVGTDPGISAEANGGTHMALEDVGILRTLPNMLIFEPVDAVQLKAALPQLVDHDGPLYLRLLRKKADPIFSEGYEFKLGKADHLRDGKDLVIFATGLTVKYALDAAAELEKEGISARVINIHTLPLDEAAVLEAAAATGLVVTVENHSVIGGLGSAVAELLGEKLPTPMQRIGIRGTYGEVGTRAYLAERFGIDAKSIVAACREAMKKKR